jgi:hypothetical protein
MLYRYSDNQLDFCLGGFGANWCLSHTFDSPENGLVGKCHTGKILSPLVQISKKEAKKLFPNAF